MVAFRTAVATIAKDLLALSRAMEQMWEQLTGLETSALVTLWAACPVGRLGTDQIKACVLIFAHIFYLFFPIKSERDIIYIGLI